MRFAEGPPQAVLGLRYRDQVRVVWHEAIGPDFDPLLPAPLGHQIQVGRIVVVAKERRLSAVAALRYVMRHPRNNQPRQSCHARKLPVRLRSS